MGTYGRIDVQTGSDVSYKHKELATSLLLLPTVTQGTGAGSMTQHHTAQPSKHTLQMAGNR